MKTEQKLRAAAGEDRPAAPGRLLRTSAGALALAALLFIPAGTLGWTAGWAYLALYSAWAFSCSFLLGLHSPELLVKRSVSVEPPRENWDKAFSVLFTPLVLTLIIVCAFQAEPGDDLLSLASRVFGFLGLACAYGLFTLSMLSNKFAVPYVGLQEGQTPSDQGPYGIIRHPMYLAAVCFFFCTPAALGSFAGFVPALALGALVLARAAGEDRFLRNHLPGYSQYAARVRYRLVPGVW